MATYDNFTEYATFAAALSSIGTSNATTLLIDHSITISSNTTVTSNITLWFVGTGALSVDSGITLTIQGPVHSDKSYASTLSGSGTITLSSTASGFFSDRIIMDSATLRLSGAYTGTLTMTATTGVTLPTTGTLATLAGTETLTNKTITAPVLSGTATGTYTLGGTPTITAPTINAATVTGTLTWSPTITGHLLFTDATYDIGASGATRPRDFFLSRNATIGGTLGVTGNVTLSGTGNSVGTISTGTWNGTAVGSQYGGTGQNTSANTGVPSISSGTWSVASTLSPTLGGTGQNTSASTGVPSVSSGTWSVASTLSPTLGGTGQNTSANTGVPSISSGTWSVASTLSTTLGGTGQNFSSTAQGSTLYFSSAGVVAALAPGTSGQFLKTQGAGANPIWADSSGASAATQAEQETASSTTVFTSPGRQQYHPSAAKAWVKFTSVTTTAINASYNVTSLTDNGTGDTTINMTTVFSSGHYGFSGMAEENKCMFIATAAAPAAGALRVLSKVSTSGAAADADNCGVAMYGDQ